MSHVAEGSFPKGSIEHLMTPYMSRWDVFHSLGPVTMCILEAMGWDTIQTCANEPAPPPPTTTTTTTTTPTTTPTTTIKLTTTPKSMPQNQDQDGDTVVDSEDLCSDTKADVLPRRYAVSHYWIWTGSAYQATYGAFKNTDHYATDAHHGCSCFQVLDTLSQVGMSPAHLKKYYRYGCTVGVFKAFHLLVPPPGASSGTVDQADKEEATKYLAAVASDTLTTGYEGEPSDTRPTSLVVGVALGGAVALVALVAVVAVAYRRRTSRGQQVHVPDTTPEATAVSSNV